MSNNSMRLLIARPLDSASVDHRQTLWLVIHDWYNPIWIKTFAGEGWCLLQKRIVSCVVQSTIDEGRRRTKKNYICRWVSIHLFQIYKNDNFANIITTISQLVIYPVSSYIWEIAAEAKQKGIAYSIPNKPPGHNWSESNRCPLPQCTCAIIINLYLHHPSHPTFHSCWSCIATSSILTSKRLTKVRVAQLQKISQVELANGRGFLVPSTASWNDSDTSRK